MSQTVLGVNAFTEQPKKRRYSVANGWQTVREWRGPRALLSTKEQEIIDTLAPESIESSDGTPAIITATFPLEGGLSVNAEQTEKDNAVFELVKVDLDRPLMTHGYFNASSANAGILEAIEDAIQHGEATTYRASLAGNQPMLDYLDLRVRGVESFWTYSWVIRCQLMTRSTSALVASQTNVGKVHTYAEAIGALPVNDEAVVSSSRIKWDQPTIYHYTNYEEAGVYGAGWQTIPVNEWLKKAPEVRQFWQGSRRMYNISQELQGAVSWSNVMYGRTTAAGAGVVFGVAGRSIGGRRK